MLIGDSVIEFNSPRYVKVAEQVGLPFYRLDPRGVERGVSYLEGLEDVISKYGHKQPPKENR